MSTILVPSLEPTYNTEKTAINCNEKLPENNLDFIVKFLNLPQKKDMNDNGNYAELCSSTYDICVGNSALVQVADIADVSPTDNSSHIIYVQNAESAVPTIEGPQSSPNCQSKNVTETANIDAADIDESVDDEEEEDMEDDEEDEEEELTNLTWLTELRNQSITWPNSMNPTILDGEEEASIAAEQNVSNIYDSMELNEKVLCLGGGAKISMVSSTNRTHSNGLGQENRCQLVNKAAATQPQIKRPTPAERYQTFMDKVKKDLREYEESAISYQIDSNEKPPFNYSHIIGMAMLEKGRVTLQQICSWIESKFAFFRVRKKWNNSIRHNLSLHHCFRKINRNKYEKGKGGYWELGVDPKKCDRKRIRNRKSSNLLNKRKTNPNQSNNSNSSYDAPTTIAPTTTATTQNEHHNIGSIINMDMDVQLPVVNMEHSEELLLDDLDVQQNIDISSNLQQQQQQLQDLQANMNEQLQHEEAFIANVLANCIEMDAGNHEITENSNELVTLTADAATTTASLQQYQLGTVIISATNDEGAVTLDGATTLNSYIYNNANIDSSNDYCNQQQHTILYREDEIPQACENVIVSSFLSDSIDTHSNSIPQRPNVIVEPLEPYYSVISASATTLVSASGECSSVTGEHFRPYIDGIDEAFQYLRSMDQNRSEDLLDNLLDISVSDY